MWHKQKLNENLCFSCLPAATHISFIHVHHSSLPFSVRLLTCRRATAHTRSSFTNARPSAICYSSSLMSAAVRLLLHLLALANTVTVSPILLRGATPICLLSMHLLFPSFCCWCQFLSNPERTAKLSIRQRFSHAMSRKLACLWSVMHSRLYEWVWSESLLSQL